MNRFTTVSLLLVGFIATYTAGHSLRQNFVMFTPPSPIDDPKPFSPPDYEKHLSSLSAHPMKHIVKHAFDFKELDQLSSLSSPAQRPIEFEDMGRLIQAQCYLKTGSDQLFQDLVASWNTVPFCMLSKMDASFMEDLGHLDASTRHEFFPKYCPQIHEAVPCLKGPIKLFRRCVDDDKVPVLWGTYNAIPEALDLICENGGEFLYRNGTNYEGCMKKSSDGMGGWNECIGLIFDTPYNIRVPTYDNKIKYCEGLTKRRDCFNRKLKECNDPRMMKLYDVFFHSQFQTSHCMPLLWHS